MLKYNIVYTIDTISHDFTINRVRHCALIVICEICKCCLFAGGTRLTTRSGRRRTDQQVWLSAGLHGRRSDHGLRLRPQHLLDQHHHVDAHLRSHGR